MLYIENFKSIQSLCSAQINMMKYCTEPNNELKKFFEFI